MRGDGWIENETGSSPGCAIGEREVDRIAPGWQATPGRFVALACRDDGSGIDPAQLDRVFEPFFTTKGDGRGTGLGLTMVRKTIEDAGGFIEVDSSRIAAPRSCCICR